MAGVTVTYWGYVCGQRGGKWRISLFSPKCSYWTFRRKVPKKIFKVRGGWSEEAGATATHWGNVCGQREGKWRICLFSPKCPCWTFLRKVSNFFSRPEEAGEWRLGLQPHIGATSLGNVDCWSRSQHGTKYVSKGCEEWRQVRDTETPTWGGWPVVPQKVIPNSSPVNRQSKWDWRSNLKIEISEERQKEAYQLVCTTR